MAAKARAAAAAARPTGGAGPAAGPTGDTGPTAAAGPTGDTGPTRKRGHAADTDRPAPPPPPWREEPHHRQRRRADHPALDRERIVEAGLRLVDAEGVEALSLRRLAVELRVTPMAVYWHVRDKAELLDLIGERVLETIVVPQPAGDWRHQLRDIHLAMLEPLLAHPNAVELMVGRARFGAAGITLFERILEILRGAGLDPASAFDAYQSLYLFQLGFTATARRSPEFRAIQAEGAAYLRSLDPAAFPAIAEVAPVIGRRQLAEQYEVGLDVVIEGIAAALVERKAMRTGRLATGG